jgi:outer membrane protein insertion porin family
MFHLYRRTNLHWFIIVSALVLVASCTTVKNYPKNKPFVFRNKITLTGDVNKDEKKRLEAELPNYWDDSIKVKSETRFGVRTIIRDPHPLDSADITRTIGFMQSYLHAQGYYNIDIHHVIDTIKNQKLAARGEFRTTVEMIINVNKNLHVASFTFDSISNPDLRQLAVDNAKESFLAKDKSFTKQLISSELDRLVTLYRSNGYIRFTRDNLFAEVDTTDVALLDLSLDPFEQAKRITEATQRRQANPTIDVAMRLRNSNDANAFTKYYVGSITYYPEAAITDVPDSLMLTKFPLEEKQREYTLKQKQGIIKFKPLREHTYMREGRVYDEQNYFKTVNALSQLGAWSQVDVRTVLHNDSIPKVDFHFFMTPAQKYSFGTDLEVSRNSGSIITGNLLGIANVLTLRNRNVWKQSIQSSTTFRNGIELGLNDTISALQTFQSSISHTFSFPKFITPFKIKGEKKLDDYKTVIGVDASYTDRNSFYRLRSGVFSFGYEWKKRNHIWVYHPLNIELYSLDTLQGLRDAFRDNPFLRTAFNTGSVVSQTLTYNLTFPGRKPNITNYFRISGEEAGALLGLFKSIQDKIYRYVKAEAEFRKLIKYRKTGLAFRVLGGIGYNYSDDPVIGQSLPFFKQFVAGGPNSMRAWPVRQLGLGSSLLSDTSTTFRDRYGDIQMEANVEFRYPLFSVGTVKVNSAVFTDIGNIWDLKNPLINPDSKLRIDRFARDLAIAVGTGVRVDFSYFLVRLDFAYKVKDPARNENNGWMSFKNFQWRNTEFPIVDASGRELKRNNYAIQLGIGLPF